MFKNYFKLQGMYVYYNDLDDLYIAYFDSMFVINGPRIEKIGINKINNFLITNIIYYINLEFIKRLKIKILLINN